MKEMKELNKSVDDIEKAIDKLQKARLSDMKYNLKQLQNYANMLFDKFCPYKIGDRVELAITPHISMEESHGWLGSRHFLIKGAKATVREVGADGCEFEFWIEFDKETYISEMGVTKGQEVKVGRKHTFHFTEKYLKPIGG